MHTSRSKHYALLSRLLSDQSRESDLPLYLAWAKNFKDGKDKNMIEPFLKGLETWLERDDADKSLRVEFGHLFLLPVGVKPFESTYRGKEKLLQQEPWVEVKRFFNKCELKLDNSYGHPEDHVAIELSFMAHVTGVGTEKALEREFFNQHIIPWVQQFFLDLRDNRYADFFRSVAEYGLLFLEKEKEYYLKTT